MNPYSAYESFPSSPDTSGGSSSGGEEPYMAVTAKSGADRARCLLNGIPERFTEFCHVDQFTFVQLADWILENAESSTAEEDISVEESLFVFFDIVARGNSFRDTAYGWLHDIKLTQNIFLNVLNALSILHAKEEISASCPEFKSSKNQWWILKGWRPGKMRTDGLVKVGDDRGDGLEVSRESLVQALTALNNFIHERKEM